MKVRRTYELKTKINKIELNDVVRFSLNDGEKVEARAVKKDGDLMLMVFEDCLKKEYRMNKAMTSEGAYEGSDLRHALNTEILERFPGKVRKHMRAFENGDFLRLLTSKEVFGESFNGDEKDEDAQLPIMKNRKNRVASQGLSGGYEWWWLQDVVSAAAFAAVYTAGNAIYHGASLAHGVRPAFLIKLSEIPAGLDPDGSEM